MRQFFAGVATTITLGIALVVLADIPLGKTASDGRSYSNIEATSICVDFDFASQTSHDGIAQVTFKGTDGLGNTQNAAMGYRLELAEGAGATATSNPSILFSGHLTNEAGETVTCSPKATENFVAFVDNLQNDARDLFIDRCNVE